MSFTTTDLIANIKRRASLPTSQDLFAAADFLAFADDETMTNLVPMLMRTKESYLRTSVDYTMSPSTTSYAIPTRALGMKLADIQVVDANGSTISLARVEEANVYSPNNDIRGFYLKGNTIYLTYTPSSSDSLRVSYFRRPGALVDVSAAAQITAINTGTLTVTVTATPSTFTTGTSIDFIKGNSGFEPEAIDQAIASISGTSITFASLPTNLAVGDWLAIAEQTPIPNIPAELHPVLAQMVAVKCLEALPDAKKYEVQSNKLDKMMMAVFEILSPRVEDEPRKLVGQFFANSRMRRIR